MRASKAVQEKAEAKVRLLYIIIQWRCVEVDCTVSKEASSAEYQLA